MIKINLSKLLGEKRIRAIEVSRKTGLTQRTLSELYNEKVKAVKLETINALCEYLNCNVCDLLEYVPDKEQKKKK